MTRKKKFDVSTDVFYSLNIFYLQLVESMLAGPMNVEPTKQRADYILVISPLSDMCRFAG